MRVDEEHFSDEIKVLEYLVYKAQRELEQSLGIPVKVRLVEPETMEQYTSSLGQIIDERANG